MEFLSDVIQFKIYGQSLLKSFQGKSNNVKNIDM